MSARFDPDRLDARDPELIARLLPAVRRINRHYLRLRVQGLENVGTGPALYVGNHNGGIAGPDLSCTLGTLWDARGPEAGLYALAHDFAMTQLTPLGAMLQKVGAMRAHPQNARRALEAEAQVLVYPGGDLDAYRHSSRRDEVVLGQRTGFVRVAQDVGVPIIPIVAHGAHRSAYIFAEGKRIAAWSGLKRWGRLERFPLALAFPWGFAPSPWLPYLPLPFPIQLQVLPKIEVPKGADPVEVRRHVQEVMQRSLAQLAEYGRPGEPAKRWRT